MPTREIIMKRPVRVMKIAIPQIVARVILKNCFIFLFLINKFQLAKIVISLETTKNYSKHLQINSKTFANIAENL
jgi:hypothetical protein